MVVANALSRPWAKLDISKPVPSDRLRDASLVRPVPPLS